MSETGRKLRIPIERELFVALCLATLFMVMTTRAQAQSVLTHHVREAAVSGEAKFLDFLPATTSLRLDVVLPLRNQAELDQLLQDLYDPLSPLYRQFLSPTEFTARFGPTQEDYDAVIRYATAHGFQVVGGSRDGMDLQIEGPVSAVESAFHVRMGVYQHPTENRRFYAPTVEPSVDLPFPLWHVSGLDTYSIPHPRLVRRPAARGSKATTGSGPSASFLGSDMRAAYYGGTALTGAGQNLGLLEYEGTDLVDLNKYFTNVGQTNSVPITLLSTDGTSTSCVYPACDDTEQTLDMTQAIGMAPGLASLVVYIGSTDTAIISAMTTHNPLPTTIGCSWGWLPADPSTLNPYFQKMATQGQNFFAASGDNSTWTSSGKSEAWPADNAYVVSVGGTDLTTASAGGPWASETAWVDSGGGISPDGIPIPSWQSQSGVINSSNKGSTTLRNGPDVSANANFTFYVCADQTTCTANVYGGTSFAAPMWAGYLALVNQQVVANGDPVLGFINPALYSIGLGSSYNTDFHDITSGTSGSYSAVTGYDLVTGWGSPNGVNLINALAGSSSGPTTLFSDGFESGGWSTAQVARTGGAWTLVSSSSHPSISAHSGSKWADFNSYTSASGSETRLYRTSGIAVSSSYSSVTLTFWMYHDTAYSSYADQVQAQVSTDGSTWTNVGPAVKRYTGTTGWAQVTVDISSYAGQTIYLGFLGISAYGNDCYIDDVAITAPGAGTADFTISALPTTVSAVQGGSGPTTITTAASSGFSNAISLSASGLPTGATATFNPTSIAAPGSGTSTLTLKAGASTPVGSSTVTITANGGGKTHTTTVTFNVIGTATTLFSDGFEGTGWSTSQVARTGGAWTLVSSSSHPSISAHGGSQWADFNSYSSASGSQTRLYRSSGFAVGSYGTVTLTFWMYHDTAYSSNADQVQAQVSTNGTTWTSVGPAISRYNGSTGWAQVNIDISSYRNSPSLQVGFLGISGYGNDCYLDDVTVTGQ